MEPGDAIFFSAWIVHGAPGNDGPDRRVALSTRWLGDDVTWFPHAGCDPTITQDDTSAVPGRYPADDERFPPVPSVGAGAGVVVVVAVLFTIAMGLAPGILETLASHAAGL